VRDGFDSRRQVQPQHADFDGMRRAWQEAEELSVELDLLLGPLLVKLPV
jgi:hypothetical protein